MLTAERGNPNVVVAEDEPLLFQGTPDCRVLNGDRFGHWFRGYAAEYGRGFGFQIGAAFSKRQNIQPITDFAFDNDARNNGPAL